MVLTSQLASVTRRLGQMGLHHQPRAVVAAVGSPSRRLLPQTAISVPIPPCCSGSGGNTPTALPTVRSFGSKKKKNKSSSKASSPGPQPERANPEDTAADQHKEWVKFQQAIAVDGFETGATTEIQRIKKGGGGSGKKRQTKRELMAERLLERERNAELRGGEYPAERYSEEETARLLEQAYNAVPRRDGKRGTRALKRQKRRWALVRKIHRKQKAHLVAAHHRRMAARAQKSSEIRSILRDIPVVRQRDREYQLSIIQRWNDTMAQSAALSVKQQMEEAEIVPP